MIYTKARQGLVGLVLAGCIIVPLAQASAQLDGGIILPGIDGGFPGLDGGFPGIDGSVLPGIDGSIPGLDGGIPGLDGGIPGIDASIPGIDSGIVTPLDGSTGTDGSTTTMPPAGSSSHGTCSVAATGATTGSSASGWLASLGVLGLVLRRARRR